MSDIKYEELHDVINLMGFDYSKYYEHEDELLKPRLEEAGFSDITFEMGERDSFGPLSRVVKCTDSEGNKRVFAYG